MSAGSASTGQGGSSGSQTEATARVRDRNQEAGLGLYHPGLPQPLGLHSSVTNKRGEREKETESSGYG